MRMVIPEAPLWSCFDLNQQVKAVHYWHPGITPKDSLFGLEFEVENVLNTNRLSSLIGKFDLGMVEDHSLRHSGWEFITNKPVSLNTAKEIITALLAGFKKESIEVSHRTSIHIHNNCLFKTQSQLLVYSVLYYLAEKPLFSYAGRNRNYSNFCVPWHALNKFPNNNRALREIPKYAALGGFRLGDLGTLEWRHFPGTLDSEHVLNWLTMIHLLDQFSNTIETRIKSVKDDFLSEYSFDQMFDLLQTIFVYCKFDKEQVKKDLLALKGYV